MNYLRVVYELIDISSEEEEEEIERERTPTPVPRKLQPNYRVVLEISHSSVDAIADEEKYFDNSADSLESNCATVPSVKG